MNVESSKLSKNKLQNGKGIFNWFLNIKVKSDFFNFVLKHFID